MTTLVLNHFNGSDGATTFTDEVPGITWSRIDAGYANELDTAVKKFGSASWLGLGSNSNDALADATGFTFPASGSFTLEAFLAPNTIASTGSWVEISLLDSGDGQQAYMVMICGGGLNHWSFGVNTPSFHDSSGAGSFSVNTFYHFALVRDVGAGTYSGYVNGSRVVQWSDANNLSTTPTKIRIGGTYSGLSSNGIGGWIDEIRLTDEVKYSGTTYTVPTSEFTIVTIVEALTGQAITSEQGSLYAWFAGNAALNVSASGSLAPAEFVGSGALSFSGLAAPAVQGFHGEAFLSLSGVGNMARPDPLRFAARRSFNNIRATPESFKRIKAVASPANIVAKVDR